MKSSYTQPTHACGSTTCRNGRTATSSFSADAALRLFVSALSLESLLIDSIISVLVPSVLLVAVIIIVA